jgi:hypothetical protein
METFSPGTPQLLYGPAAAKQLKSVEGVPVTQAGPTPLKEQPPDSKFSHFKSTRH